LESPLLFRLYEGLIRPIFQITMYLAWIRLLAFTRDVHKTCAKSCVQPVD